MPEIAYSEFAPRLRKSYARIKQIIDTPNLLDIQRASFDRFLQIGVEMEKRENVGLQAVFQFRFSHQGFQRHGLP